MTVCMSIWLIWVVSFTMSRTSWKIWFGATLNYNFWNICFWIFRLSRIIAESLSFGVLDSQTQKNLITFFTYLKLASFYHVGRPLKMIYIYIFITTTNNQPYLRLSNFFINIFFFASLDILFIKWNKSHSTFIAIIW